MDKIKVFRLEDDADELSRVRRISAFAARLTQRGHVLSTVEDVKALYVRPVSDDLFTKFMDMPHPTLQKFAVINYCILGASRRFLAQVTRHQNEVKFMSGSLQYSDYAAENAQVNFTVPYELLDNPEEREKYLRANTYAMKHYYEMRESGIDNDTCGYTAPQGLRNILLISATPFQWKHMIQQRICRRNTAETRYVFLRIWEDLYNIPDGELLFAPKHTLPECCREGNLSCGQAMNEFEWLPHQLLIKEFPLCCREDD